MKKKVLFVCVENACRSQMAEALTKAYYADVVEPFSAGSKPSEKVNPIAISVLDEIDVDISKSRPKSFVELDESTFDYVITMGCEDTCPFVPSGKHEDWHILDPKGKDIAFFRKTRDEIKLRLNKLIEKIKKEIS